MRQHNNFFLRYFDCKSLRPGSGNLGWLTRTFGISDIIDDDDSLPSKNEIKLKF